MSASPVKVTDNPLYLNARSLVYTAEDIRNPWGDVVGTGVQDQDSFRIRQRAAGANMSVDGMTASVLNRAFIRGATIPDQGIYRVDFNNATPLNVDVSAADPTNPRIDSVYLCIEDQQHAGSNNQATLRMVTGVATGGATLANRTGAGAAPAGMSSILLADILVGAGVSSITNANIQDRRPVGVIGATPSSFTALDSVSFTAPPGVTILNTGVIQSTSSFDAQQQAALVWLPRRIVLATRIRLRYLQGATANTNNFNFGIFDASARSIVTTGAVAYTGTANQVVNHTITIGATTFDIGYYWLWLGNAAGVASGQVNSQSIGANSTGSATLATAPNMFAFAATGGTTAPTRLFDTMTDLNTVSGAAPTIRGAVPICSLSVG